MLDTLTQIWPNPSNSLGDKYDFRLKKLEAHIRAKGDRAQAKGFEVTARAFLMLGALLFTNSTILD